MTVTYQPDLSRALDRLRFDVGDVDTTAPLLPDETYTAMLISKASDERLATLALADALISRYAQMPSKVVTAGGSDVTWSNRLAGWQALSTRLRAEIKADATAASAEIGTSYTARAVARW